ncbi:hypothetical protein DZS_37720 [Dickeya ananatis]
MPDAQGALGFACFAATMTLGRLTGDRVVTRLGAQPVVMLGAALAVTGLMLAVWVPFWSVALLGYALIGLGCSNIVPVMFSAIGRQTSMPQAAAVPAVTTLGYLGILAGPASIGFIAHHSSLSAAFFSGGGLAGTGWAECQSGEGLVVLGMATANRGDDFAYHRFWQRTGSHTLHYPAVGAAAG